MSSSNDAIQILALLVFLAAIYIFVGTMDYDDELAQQEYACEMVKRGYWPEYKNLKCEK